MARYGFSDPQNTDYFRVEALLNDLTRIALASNTKRALAVSILDSNGNQVSTPSTIGDGRKTVTSAGTAETLVASSTACKSVTITALEANTDAVCIGASTVVAALATRRGTPLLAGDSVTIVIDDLQKLYIDSVVNGEGVSFHYTN